jgi:serine/threonine protein kinase
MPEDLQISGYRVIEKLGQGGMAEVYLADRPGPHEARKVALKRMLRPLHDDDGMRSLFDAELKLVSQLHHPNIVQSYDSGECDDGRIYLVMEYVAGTDLHQLLRAYRGELLPIEVAVQIATQAAAALEYVHSSDLSVIHRDVSPSNILLGEYGDVKLTDFGIARFRGRDVSTCINFVKGKLGYMSPEQFTRPDYDHRSDLFSLGSVLYEMLTGVPAFKSHDGHTLANTMQRVLYHTPAPVREVRSDVPLVLSDLVQAMLQKQAKDRISSAADIREILLGLPVQHDPRAVRRCVLHTRACKRSALREAVLSESRSANSVALPHTGRPLPEEEGTKDVSLADLQLAVPNIEPVACPSEPLGRPDQGSQESDALTRVYAAASPLTPVHVPTREPVTEENVSDAPPMKYHPAPRATLGGWACSEILGASINVGQVETASSIARRKVEAATKVPPLTQSASTLTRVSHGAAADKSPLDALADQTQRDARGTAMLDELLSRPLPVSTATFKEQRANAPAAPLLLPRHGGGGPPPTRPLRSRLTLSAVGAALVVGIGLGEMRGTFSHDRARSESLPAPRITHVEPRGGSTQEQPAAQFGPMPATNLLPAPTQAPNALDLPALPILENAANTAAALAERPRRVKPQVAPDSSAPPTAKLRVVLVPWGHVWLDGHPVGVAPAQLSTTPGRHRLDVGQGAPSRTELVVLREGENRLAFDL